MDCDYTYDSILVVYRYSGLSSILVLGTRKIAVPTFHGIYVQNKLIEVTVIKIENILKISSHFELLLSLFFFFGGGVKKILCLAYTL